MKTIEERADEYIGHSLDIDEPFFVTSKRSAFIAGAKSEHEELVKWNDPNKLSGDTRDVLVKFCDPITHNIQYATGFFADGWWHTPAYNEILGWREIYE